MKIGRTLSLLATVAAAALALAATPSSAVAQEAKPNIIVIMGDDIGWENIGAYHQGLMYDTTPNLDKLAAEGMRSLIITPSRAARRGAPISSPGNCRFAPD
jgi:Sulfatase